MDEAPERYGCLYEAAFLLGFCAFVAVLAMLNGCVYRGAKVVEGTDLAVGLSVPAADGAADLTVFNYLSGFRLGVAKDAAMTVKYSAHETNSWFGVCTTRSSKTVAATVTPVCTNGCGCADKGE